MSYQQLCRAAVLIGSMLLAVHVEAIADDAGAAGARSPKPARKAKPDDAAGNTRKAAALPDDSLLQMTQQLDQLDKMDFDAAIEEANACTRNRNYTCTEKQLAKAAKFARGAQDKHIMQLAQQSLAAEKQREAEERRRRREEEERLAREEEERREAEWREARRRREAEDDDDSGASIGAAILQGLAKSQADAAQLTSIHNNMVRNLNAQVAQRQREQAEQRTREIEQQNRERRQREEELRERREAQQRNEQLRLAQLDQQRSAQQREQERTAQQERERVQREQERVRREAELAQQAREQAMRKEEERQKRERERAEQLAAKEAEKAAAARSRRDYLQTVLRGTRLLARKCPGGDGMYYLVGKRPSVKPEVVSCMDVHYHAYCPGQTVGTRGVAKNFLGASTDCYFGDAVTIDPKPACAVDQVRVEATEVRECGE